MSAQIENAPTESQLQVRAKQNTLPSFMSGKRAGTFVQGKAQESELSHEQKAHT